MSSTDILPNIKLQSTGELKPVNFRGFGGGWNAVFDDLLMGTSFLVTASNVYRTASGAAKLRFGSQWIADVTGTVQGTNIIDQEYFNGKLVCVTDAGEIVTVEQDGTKTKIWDDTIAGMLPGTPDGWSTDLTSIDFVPFRGELVIHNGEDKPITIDTDFAVTYLQDLATGSNVNTPIGKYGCTVANYHCVAGIANEPTTVYISSSGTAGTFPGDNAPNDAISIDVGAYAPEGAPEIRGIAGFRSNLIVFFQGQSLVVTLGVYDADGNHTPTFPDSMPARGLLGHRCIAKLPNDLQFADFNGLSSAKRNLVSGLYDSRYLSEFIEPAYRRIVGGLTDTQRRLNCFTVYDPINHLTLIMFPEGEAVVYSANEELRYKGWSKFEDMNYQCGCTTELGRVYMSSGMRIYQLGNGVFADEDFNADMLLDRDKDWANATVFTAGDLVFDSDTEEVYTCNVSHTSSTAPLTFENDRSNFPEYWTIYLGEAISFDVEMPWIDGKDPMKTKQLRFGKIGTQGTAEFTLKIYVDNLYKDEDGAEIYDPALEIELIGNDAGGFGVDAGPMGGGRPSDDPRLYSMPCKFKTIKFRFTGSTRKPLTIANQSYLFSKGKFRR